MTITIIRSIPPKRLDMLSASPFHNTAEFQYAWDAIKPAGKVLCYLGTDGQTHYFQEWGVREAYCVPVSHGFVQL